MSEIVSYQENDKVVLIIMDDGKANAVSPLMLTQLNDALDQAEKSAKVVVITGRPGKFSAGFDLSIMSQGGGAMANLVVAGAHLALRLLRFPTPVVMACTGHGLAMGGLMLLSADYRIGVEGAFKIGLNEAAIGMTMPLFGVEIARGRLHPAHLGRAVINAEVYAPHDAIVAGFLDQVTTEESLLPVALEIAGKLATLNMSAHHMTKLRVRQPLLTALADGIEKEFGLLVQ